TSLACRGYQDPDAEKSMLRRHANPEQYSLSPTRCSSPISCGGSLFALRLQNRQTRLGSSDQVINVIWSPPLPASFVGLQMLNRFGNCLRFGQACDLTAEQKEQPQVVMSGSLIGCGSEHPLKLPPCIVGSPQETIRVTQLKMGRDVHAVVSNGHLQMRSCFGGVSSSHHIVCKN